MENDKITNTRETLVKDADDLKRNVGKVAQDVKEHATAHVDFVKDHANDTYQQLSNYARENPIQVVAGAFVLGFVIASWRRR